jgi:CheY-like chemotaxis protein
MPADPPTEARRYSGAILLADDENLVRRVTERQLRMMGFEVLAAADGAAAVDLFAANADRVRLAILDMSMPRLGGVEAAAQMRASRPDLPVVFFSGYGEDAAPPPGPGHTAFLSKPFTQAQLDARIAEALGEAPRG